MCRSCGLINVRFMSQKSTTWCQIQKWVNGESMCLRTLSDSTPTAAGQQGVNVYEYDICIAQTQMIPATSISIMSFSVGLVIVVLLLSVVSAKRAKHSVQFRQVSIMGETLRVPFTYMPNTNKNVTTLLIAEKAKLKFVINTAISITKHSGGAGAFALLCVDCKDDEADKWGKKGIHLIGSKFLEEAVTYAFRLDGPMPYNATLPTGDMRRHSVHMLYREWIKATLLEYGLTVFLADIDIAFTSSMPFFTAQEDIVLEGHWPNEFRKNWYSYQFHKDVWVVLNNGVALFTPTPAMLSFSRQFMGLMIHSVVADFGFAQASFVQHLHDLNLELHKKKRHLVGEYEILICMHVFSNAKPTISLSENIFMQGEQKQS